jgi:hypothetical protein
MVTHGPLIQTKEALGGYWIFQVTSDVQEAAAKSPELQAQSGGCEAS